MISKAKKIYIGSIVKVNFDDGTFRLARVVNIDRNSELVMVVFLNEILEDEELETVSLLNVEKFEGKLN